MEAKRKRQLKRRYKTFTWLGYSSIAFFVLFLITIFIVRSHTDADWSVPTIMIPILIGIFLPFFMAMAFFMFSGMAYRELISYKNSIQRYRARKFGINTIEYLQEGELLQAINEYTKCKDYPETSLNDYIYGMIIMACYHSKDEEKHMTGILRLGHMKKTYDPTKVKL